MTQPQGSETSQQAIDPPLTTWVELRVHGVSGTPAESMLANEHVEQIAGDNYSRFYSTVPRAVDHELEAYHWGGFTSGSWRHALTLLFLPFGMVNAAQFMLLPPEDDQDKLVRRLNFLSRACLRVLGLLLTGLFSFALGLILVDLIGWRWSPKSNLLDGFDTSVVLPGCVAVAALGVVLLSLLNRPGFIRPPEPSDDDSRLKAHSALELKLYRATSGSRLLRRLHLATGLVMVALLGDLARTGSDPDADGGPLRIAIEAALVALAVAVLLMGDALRRSALPADESFWTRLWGKGSVLFVLAAAGLVVAVIVDLTKVDNLPGPKDVPAPAFARLAGVDGIANGLMAVGLSLLLVLAVTVGVPAVVRRFWSPTTEEAHYFRPYAWGWTAFLVAALGVFIAIGFSAAAATTVASSLELNADEEPAITAAAAGDVKVGTTLMLDRVAYVWGLTVVELLVLATVVGVGYWAAKWTFEERVQKHFTPPSGEDTALPAGWDVRVARAMYVAQLKHAVPLIVIVLVLVGVGMSVVQYLETTRFPDQFDLVDWVQAGLIGSAADDPLPSWIGWLSEPRKSGSSIVWINVGAWALVAGAGAIVALSRGALKNSGVRRGINVVWDVFGFWPHVVHPFGPEPYSRWTVIELRNRIRYHLKRKHTGSRPAVVVCAHSQGSVIAFAALLLLEEKEQKRVALLTCGSQLRVIYPRAFPAYFNHDIVSEVFGALDGRWVNLYRTTDPLAGPVLSWNHDDESSGHLPADVLERLPQKGDRLTRRSGNDWRLVDPIPADRYVQTGAVYVIHGHHDYWRDPSWQTALDALRADGAERGKSGA